LTDKADEAIEVDEVIEANEASLAEANELLATNSIVVIKNLSCCLMNSLSYLLTFVNGGGLITTSPTPSQNMLQSLPRTEDILK
jgi:hypothetical protein